MSAIKKAIEALRRIVSLSKSDLVCRNAYHGAMDEMRVWKNRCLAAEQELREERESNSRLCAELNSINGPAFMGDPVLPKPPVSSVPKGWNPVPVNPNWDMVNEGREMLIDGWILSSDPGLLAVIIFSAMIAAAPTPENAL